MIRIRTAYEPHHGRVVSPVAYWVAVAIGGAAGAALCITARHRPGRWTIWPARALSIVLVAVAVAFIATPIVTGTWSVRSSLPLDLCDVAVLIAAAACWQPGRQLAVELTYYWGLAGTLQAVSTPDLSVAFPHLVFFEFVVAHLAIVIAAGYLVVGLGRRPGRGSVARVFGITAAYTAVIGVVDWLTGANYMYLRAVPGHASLLSVLGPWPWYLLSAAVVALILLFALDLPFRRYR
jgi:hypothetical integral membrane protein (TIGR02206 family)